MLITLPLVKLWPENVERSPRSHVVEGQATITNINYSAQSVVKRRIN